MLRKTVLTALAVCSALLLASGAEAQTNTSALNQAAISVKDPAHVFLDAVAMAGRRIVAVGEHGVIIYSDDDGKSWTQAKVPVDVLLTAVAFASPEEGWAAGHQGVILHTADGGKIWQTQLNGDQVNELALKEAKAAQAANSPLPTTALAVKRAAYFLKTGADKPFLAIEAMSPQKAIVIGAYRIAVRTDDGGKSWTGMSLSIEDRLSHNLYGITNTSSGLYICEETGLVFHSTDNGATFPQVTPTGNATMFGILGTRGGGIFTFGVAGNAYLSHDEGATWQKIDVGTDSNLTAGIILKSGAVLVAGESGTLHISYNNAQTFQQVPQIVPLAIASLAQMPDGQVIAVGIGGVDVLPQSDFVQAK